MDGFQIASVRPPTENFSLAISTHFYCPHGKCAFCPSQLFSQTPKFQRRTLDEILNDIDNAARLDQMLLQSDGTIETSILHAISRFPALRDCIIHLAYWHAYSNGTTAFLGGANPLLYKKEFLKDVMTHLKIKFPSINRITSYGRTRTAAKKGSSFFKTLQEAGLDRIHVGLESGSNKVLELMNKGTTSEYHILGGINIKEGEISLCTYVMPGLGGKKWSKEHALETARVINEIEPDFVRLRTLEIFPATPLYLKLKSGDFVELTEEEVVKEEKILVENINCNTTITSDSAANLLIEIWGDLPKDKEKILRAIDRYLDLSVTEKVEFSLKRRLEAFSSQYGGLSEEIQRKMQRLSNLSKNDEKYYEKMEKLIKFIRKRLIP
ncbi:MAG: radical SAM protein [Promethearchaeota archaeon]